MKEKGSLLVDQPIPRLAGEKDSIEELRRDLDFFVSSINRRFKEISSLFRDSWVYYPRTTPDEPDFANHKGNLPITSSEIRELDLAPIFGNAFPKACRFKVELNATTAGESIRLFPSQSVLEHQKEVVVTQSTNQIIIQTIFMPIYSDRIVYYRLTSATYNTCNLIVLGWWE